MRPANIQNWRNLAVEPSTGLSHRRQKPKGPRVFRLGLAFRIDAKPSLGATGLGSDSSRRIANEARTLMAGRTAMQKPRIQRP